MIASAKGAGHKRVEIRLTVKSGVSRYSASRMM